MNPGNIISLGNPAFLNYIFILAILNSKLISWFAYKFIEKKKKGN